jgi:hypothetical protein
MQFDFHKTTSIVRRNDKLFAAFKIPSKKFLIVCLNYDDGKKRRNWEQSKRNIITAVIEYSV